MTLKKPKLENKAGTQHQETSRHSPSFYLGIALMESIEKTACANSVIRTGKLRVAGCVETPRAAGVWGKQRLSSLELSRERIVR